MKYLGANTRETTQTLSKMVANAVPLMIQTELILMTMIDCEPRLSQRMNLRRDGGKNSNKYRQIDSNYIFWSRNINYYLLTANKTSSGGVGW